MLCEITDSTALGELFARGRVTRAELSSVTGISGPTIWESVRRLAGAGLLSAAGSQETPGRGRAATRYELAGTADGSSISGAHGLACEIGYLPAAVGNGQHARFSPVPLQIAADRSGVRALQGTLHLALNHGRQQMVTGRTVSPGHAVSPRKDTG